MTIDDAMTMKEKKRSVYMRFPQCFPRTYRNMFLSGIERHSVTSRLKPNLSNQISDDAQDVTLTESAVSPRSGIAR